MGAAKRKEVKDNPVWPFPKWKDGKMVPQKVKMPTKREQRDELPCALM